jgi:hypothetical protein
MLVLAAMRLLSDGTLKPKRTMDYTSNMPRAPNGKLTA